MDASLGTPTSSHAPALAPQAAELDARLGSASLHVRVHMTPAGLLAVGGMVSGILLSVAALVWTATSVRRRHPIASAWRRR
ncbi:hypothetical protein [Rhizobacter sp. LjRoot28]|uniref:hypothetical protein n=1 Tax=Rhizobacter sp. LjRoot28 TaxID=3342309 RepID=UPI003ECF3B2B